MERSHEPRRPPIDPERVEQARRVLRDWLERVAIRVRGPADTSIDWEDGERRDDHRHPRY